MHTYIHTYIHPDFLDGLPAYFDITVRNSLLPQFITVAATCPGAAADSGEREKDDDVTHAGALFYPLVVESGQLTAWKR